LPKNLSRGSGAVSGKSKEIFGLNGKLAVYPTGGSGSGEG
jgi:hypothetical protein